MSLFSREMNPSQENMSYATLCTPCFNSSSQHFFLPFCPTKQGSTSIIPSLCQGTTTTHNNILSTVHQLPFLKFYPKSCTLSISFVQFFIEATSLQTKHSTSIPSGKKKHSTHHMSSPQLHQQVTAIATTS